MKLKKWHMYVSLYAILLSTIFCSVFLCFNILPTHAASLTVGTLDKEEYFVVNNGYLVGLSSSGTEVANNYDLLNVIIPDGVTNFSSSGFIYQYQTQIESIVLPASLTNIESSTFTVCSNLKSVDLSNTSVARIGYRAFYNCTNLSNIKFPNSLTAIESEAFAGCNNLISLDLSDTNITSIYYRTFYMCTNLTTIQFPDSLSVIETDAFFECNSLENINLSNTNVSSIKYRAFSNCNSLTSVSFPNSLTTVETNSFSGCNSLKSVDLSNTNVTVIEYCTFYDCTNLTNVVLPESLISIESSAFSECNNIEVFICPNPDVFENCKDEILNSYTDKVIYNIGVQFNLTDHENNQSVFYEKILVSEDLKDWHFINGEWIVDPDYVYGEGLPTLPYGYIWQDEFGYELTDERIQALLIEAENQNQLMTINVSAVEKPKKLITITGLTSLGKIYDGNDIANVDFSEVQYDGIVGDDEVWVELKSGIILHYDSANTGERVIQISYNDLLLKGADAVLYFLPNSLIINVPAIITPGEIKANPLGGVVTYDENFHDTITPGEVVLCAGATAADVQSIKWQFSYDNGQSWQTEINKSANVCNTEVKWRVTANNHKTLNGSVSFIIKSKKIEIPKVTSEMVFIYDGTIKTCEITTSKYYTVYNNQQIEVGTYHVKVSLNDKQNCAWVNGKTDDLDFVFTITRNSYEQSVKYISYNNVYDGYQHDAITIIEPTGENVNWLFKSEEDENYQTKMPQFTKPGTYVVYYKIEFATLYDDYYGKFFVEIRKAKLTIEIAAHTVSHKKHAKLSNFTVSGLVNSHDNANVIELICDGYNVDTAKVGDTYNIKARIKDMYSDYYEIEFVKQGILSVVEDLSIEIPPTVIEAPTASNQSFIFTGKNQTYIPMGYNPNTMTIEGNKKTNVGVYTVTVRPQTNFVFANEAEYVEFEFVINKANIVVRKNKDEWFDERIGDQLVDDLTISFLTIENGTYKYIVTANNCDLLIEFDQQIYNEGEIVTPNYDTKEAPTITKNMASGRYLICYRITDPAGNHNLLEGTWKIEIADKEEYIVVIFNKAFTVKYGQDHMSHINTEIFNPSESYITVYEYVNDESIEMSLSEFAKLVDPYIIYKNANSYGLQNIGTYDICFKYKNTVNESRTIVYKETNNSSNTNEDKLIIQPAEIKLNWNKLEYSYKEGVNYDVISDLADQVVILENHVLNLHFVVRDANGNLIDKVTKAGSYTVEAVLQEDYGNFVIEDSSRTRILEVKELSNNYPSASINVWVAGSAFLIVITVLGTVIVIMRKKQ